MRHSEGDKIVPRDCVLLKAGPRKNDLPFVAKIAALWENPEDGKYMFSAINFPKYSIPQSYSIWWQKYYQDNEGAITPVVIDHVFYPHFTLLSFYEQFKTKTNKAILMNTSATEPPSTIKKNMLASNKPMTDSSDLTFLSVY